MTTMNDPTYFTVEQLRGVGLWPLPYLSGLMMVPYINRLSGDELKGIEVGVLKGETATVVLEACPKVKTYYGVDPYREYFDVDHIKTQDQMNHFKEVAEKNLSKHPQYKLVDVVPEGLVDFILIDGNHSYENVLTDLNTYYPLLREGGIMFCHDYNNDEVRRAITDWRRSNRVSNPIMVMPNFLWVWYK